MIEPTEIDHATARLDAWLETLRGPGANRAYGGPITHWWQQSLLYTGPGYDWRYEGILLGYLSLWQRSAENRWLNKALRAGDDLLNSQLLDGHFPASAFEMNPAIAGTPHEAAVSLGLLELASSLKSAQLPGWEKYLAAAEKLLCNYYRDVLWDTETLSFRDHPQIASFVPNKAATACQALFSLSKLKGDALWAEKYALPNLERILAHQVKESGPLQGAIAQNSFGKRIVAKYMPYYIARCVPGLLQGYIWSGQESFLNAALQAMNFVIRQRNRFGGFPPAVYTARQKNHWPQWVAALGDVLLAAEMLQPYGLQYNMDGIQSFLLNGQDATGGVQTARGFGAQAGGQPGEVPDFRDLLHVAGWCDKAFHWLALHTSGTPLPPANCQPYKTDCAFQGLELTFYEGGERVEAIHSGKTVYLWVKGEAWAREATPEFWLH